MLAFENIYHIVQIAEDFKNKMEMEAILLERDEAYLRMIAEEIQEEQRKVREKKQKQFELNLMILAENEREELRRQQVYCEN